MGFFYGQISVNSVDDFNSQIHAKLLAAGWTDITQPSGPPAAKSAVDAQGRYCAVELSKETISTTDYPLWRVSNITDFSTYVIQKGGYHPNSGQSFPQTFDLYVNEFWFIVIPAAANAYPLGAGLFEPPADATAEAHPAPIFLIANREPGVTTYTYVYFFANRTYGQTFVFDDTDTIVEAAVGPTFYDEHGTNYAFVTPPKRLTMRPVILDTGKWYGFLPYAVCVLGTQMTAGTAVNISGVYYTALNIAGGSLASLAVRTA